MKMKEFELWQKLQNTLRPERQRVVENLQKRLEQLTSRTGFVFQEVEFSVFQARTDNVQAEEASRGIFPWMSDLVKADLGYPMVSDWILAGQGDLKFTAYAFTCFSGVVVRSDGALRLFHFPSSWTWDKVPELLQPSEVVDGLVGSRSSLKRNAPFQAPGRKNSELYTNELGLLPVSSQLETPGPFHILVDPQSKEVWWSYGPNPTSETR